ncbi:DUF1616 domain-containing protein [Haloferax sp. CBA1148]|nr:DUF1616 domain-containing protein [Haloferax sp. CBA1148]
MTVVIMSYVFAYLQPGTLVRTMVGVPILLFLPGYSLLLALYPGKEEKHERTSPDFRPTRRGSGVSVLERLALAFGMSIALLPIAGLVLLWSGFELNLTTVLSSLSAIIVVGIAVGEFRRLRLDPNDRFHIPLRYWYNEVTESFNRPSKFDSVLNVALAIAVVFAVASVGYTVFTPSGGEAYSSITLLTQDASGEYVASGYPSSLSTDESTELYVSVSNYEGEETTYTLVAELQRLNLDGEMAVVERQQLGQRSETIGDGETWQTRHSFTPQLTGENFRLTYFLYKGDAPEDPSVETAYRSTYIWLSVSDA